jgi:hypothetical protein
LALSQDLQLPIGWQTEIYTPKEGEACEWGIPSKNGCIQFKESVANQSAGPLAKLLGLLLTALAISQGAPFWFDLLSKVSNQRGSGAVPAASQEQTKKKV